MKYIEIQECKKGITEVNEMIGKGWELIQCVPLPHAVVYVIGRRQEEEKDKPEKPAYKK